MLKTSKKAQRTWKKVTVRACLHDLIGNWQAPLENDYYFLYPKLRCIKTAFSNNFDESLSSLNVNLIEDIPVISSTDFVEAPRNPTIK